MGSMFIDPILATSEVAAWRNQLEASKWMVALKNPQLENGYRAKAKAFNDALQNGIEHHPENYPTVPASWVLDPKPPDNLDDLNFYVFYTQTGPPVCDPIPMWKPQPRVVPGNVDINFSRKDGAFFDAGPLDGVANNEIVKGPDGKRYQKIGTYLGTNVATGAIPGYYMLLPDAPPPAEQAAK